MALAARTSLVLFFLCSFIPSDLTVVAAQEQLEPVPLVPLHNLHSANNPPLAAVLTAQHLRDVSTTVLAAETWLRSYILSSYPSTKFTHIVVGHNVACSPTYVHEQSLLLPSLKNLHYSLTRWSLQHEIKVSPSLSSHCFRPRRGEFAVQTFLLPLLEFIHDTNSTYILNPIYPKLPAETNELVYSHLESLKKLASFDVNVQVYSIHPQKTQEFRRPISRKLYNFEHASSNAVVDPFPARPTPLPRLTPSTSDAHLSYPAHIAKSPLPPLIGTNSAPPPYYHPSPLPFPPEHNSPTPTFPSPPPFDAFHLPPCNPLPGGTASPPDSSGLVQKLWCVAKPSVPAETLKDALDFACGEADCDEIGPSGKCYSPDTLVAHASYAFNSYWQKTKRNGGTCDFGGTAMIINADPSFLQCTFEIS